MSGATDTGHEVLQGEAKGILTDVTKCIGCERCVEACVQVNKLPADPPAHFKAGDGLSGSRFTSIVKIPGKGPEDWRMVRRQCMHCLDPACQAACLVGAFEKMPDGPVVYDPVKCIGCRYCMLACPFTIPRYEYDKQLPYVKKCKMNEDCRVEGGMPACVSACPTGATIFGPRKLLIEEARRRIAAEPGKYVNHIYGEQEFGGTSVIYISDVPLNDPLDIPTKEGVRETGHSPPGHRVHSPPESRLGAGDALPVCGRDGLPLGGLVPEAPRQGDGRGGRR